MIHVGDILSTLGDVQYRGGIQSFVIWIQWGYHDACGGYHEYHGGCSVPWGYSSNKRFFLTVLNTPRYHDIPHGTQDIPRST